MNNTTISFGLPELGGLPITFRENKDLAAVQLTLTLYPAMGENIAVTLLDFLKNDKEHCFYLDLEHTLPVTIIQSEDSICFKNQTDEMICHVTPQKFLELLTSHIKEYSLYFAAPVNYKAFFQLPFDHMVSKMEHYRDREHKLLQTLDLL